MLIRDLTALYTAARAGRAASLPDLLIQYADFAAWQRRWLQGPVLDKQLAYWHERLSGAPAVFALSTDYPRPAVQNDQGSRHRLFLPSALCVRLQRLSRTHDVTLFMALLAAFYVLLYHETGCDDLVVGTDVANRNRMEIEGLTGFFVNLLALRADLRGNPRFDAVLSQVREVTLGAYAHQDLPFEKIVQALRPGRDLAHNPLVQVLFVLQNAPAAPLEIPGLQIQRMELDSGVSRFDLGVFLTEHEQGLAGDWVYRTVLFKPETVARLADRFRALLARIAAHPEHRLSDLQALTPAEQRAQRVAQDVRRQAKLARFKSIRPQAVRVSQRELLTTGYLNRKQELPLVIRSAVDDLDAIGWAQAHREWIEARLLEYGALLFRGFPLSTTADFERLAQVLCNSELFGEYGDLPHEKLSDKLYGATPYPPDRMILFHNESSHLHRWPMKQFFFCVQAAAQGGQTPIIDCREVYRRLDPQLRARFERKQLLYVRHFGEGLDVSWQDFFHTTERTEVEARCRQAGVACEWTEHNGLRTRELRPAVARHPRTRDPVFFNQLQLHHASCLETGLRQSAVTMLGEAGLPRNVYYGDGSPIEDTTVVEIRALYEQLAVDIVWQTGDALMLDNMLVAHARRPYQGPRQLIVALGEMIAQTELDRAPPEHQALEG